MDGAGKLAVGRPMPTVGAAAPRLGGGKELLVLAAGVLVLYVLYVSARQCLRRLGRFLGMKPRQKGKKKRGKYGRNNGD